jgi:hypothetical protein
LHVIFQAAQTSAPENQTAPVFYVFPTGCPELPKFKLRPKLFFQQIESFCLLSSNFTFSFLIHFCEWCGFEPILMGWKSTHENS